MMVSAKVMTTLPALASQSFFNQLLMLSLNVLLGISIMFILCQ